MARHVRLGGPSVYNAEWLSKRMDELEIGDTELHRRMQDRGYPGAARTVVTGWRTGRNAIPADVFPILALALDYDIESMARMTVDHVADTMPFLEPFVVMPSLPELGDLEKNMLKAGLAARKARLMAELSAISELENS